MALGVSSSEVELRVSLRNLRNKDVMSKTDAFVVVSVKSDLRPDDGVGGWVGRSVRGWVRRAVLHHLWAWVCVVVGGGCIPASE
jgi:hypothetical protein